MQALKKKHNFRHRLHKKLTKQESHGQDTRHGTRVLSVKGTPRLEVEEDELGTPVTTKHHIKIPPRYSAFFEVNLHGNCEGTKIISPNKQLMEVNPNVFQHEISIKPEGNKYFPVVAVTNLDHAKMLH